MQRTMTVSAIASGLFVAAVMTAAIYILFVDPPHPMTPEEPPAPTATTSS